VNEPVRRHAALGLLLRKEEALLERLKAESARARRELEEVEAALAKARATAQEAERRLRAMVEQGARLDLGRLDRHREILGQRRDMEDETSARRESAHGAFRDVIDVARRQHLKVKALAAARERADALLRRERERLVHHEMDELWLRLARRGG
jgi:hypothetical protein